MLEFDQELDSCGVMPTGRGFLTEKLIMFL